MWVRAPPPVTCEVGASCSSSRTELSPKVKHGHFVSCLLFTCAFISVRQSLSNSGSCATACHALRGALLNFSGGNDKNSDYEC
jgi:hypothetical protein